MTAGTRRRRRLPAAAVAALLSGLAACGSPTAATRVALTARDTLIAYAGPGDFREVLHFAVTELLPPTAGIRLADAPPDANQQIVAGAADLAFAQEWASFQAGRAGYPSLGVVSRVNVVPYAVYSATWTRLADIPHGGKVVLPGRTEDFARGLYLLQNAGPLKLDRPFGGITPADLTITEDNVTDQLRHLTLPALHTGERLAEIFPKYDAFVLTPAQAAVLGLDPADALAVEPAPRNPYVHVLVAPARLGTDPRVVALVRALESPRLARFLKQRYRGANVSAAVAP
jgi:D-methionine transport system substrate-binding protein